MYSLDCWSEAEIKKLDFQGVYGKVSLWRKRNLILAPAHLWMEVILVLDKGEKDVPWARSNSMFWFWLGMRLPYAQWHFTHLKMRRSSRLTISRLHLPKGWIRPRVVFLLCMQFSDAFLISVAFQKRDCNGLVLDKMGNKMSSDWAMQWILQDN